MAAKVSAQGNVTVELHKRETSGQGYWGHPGICTVTFCTGDPKATAEAIRSKLLAVLNANPWVAGQFERKTLVHPETCSDALVDEILSVRRCPGVKRTTEYTKLVKTVAKDPSLAVQGGAATQKSGARVTKLVVVEPESLGQEFALVFSMSHVAADGHDYYRIFNMLVGNAAVEAMVAVRVAEFEDREPEWTGPKDFAWLSGGGLIKGMLSGLLFGPKSKWCCHYVDQAAVSAKKAAAKGQDGCEFVSTNDVLTSHFCNASDARVCMMVINYRGKIALEIGDSHAGCYEGCLLLDAANYSTPNGVRKCLNAGVPFTRQTASPPLPGFCGKCSMAFITSWASFPFEVNLPGVEQVLHLPCMDMPDVMDVAIVFNPQPGRLGMIYMAKRCKGKLTGPDTVLGDPVSAELFPQ